MGKERVGKFLPLKDLQMFVGEAVLAQSDMRAEAWRDCECYDGNEAMWTQEDWDDAVDAGIDPITINRIFPVVSLIQGLGAVNKTSIQAKGRTSKDSDTGMIMTESIQFIIDQYDGEALIDMGIRDQLLAGWGNIKVGLNSDPRREKVGLFYRDWKEVWWDPFGSPWLDPLVTKYVFSQKWTDLETVKAMFPEKDKDIDQAFQEMTHGKAADHSPVIDEASQVEFYMRMYGTTGWADTNRHRVRPVEIWYVVYERAAFAVFPDGRCIELGPNMQQGEMYNAILNSQSVVSAVVPKIKTCTFLGDIELQHIDSPYDHGLYPFAPFVCYTDRYGQPFGVPRQLRGQNVEINKRRSMALALLRKRRLIAEEGVVNPDQNSLDNLYSEANKLDGLMIVKDGKLNALKLEEHNELFPAHIKLLEMSEQEIKEISGANAELAGYQSNAESGVAIERRQQQGATMTAPIFNNVRRTHKILGALVGANIQQFWTGEKIIRVTDRLTGADKFLALNQQFNDPANGQIRVKNDITQGKYDYITTQAPLTDTVRERYMNMVIEWIKKSPPEIVPVLLNIAFEMSDLPNKETLLQKMRPLMGIDPTEEDMTPEQIKQRAIQQAQAKAQKEAQAMAWQEEGIQLDLHNKKLLAAKTQGEIEANADNMRIARAKAVKDLTAPTAAPKAGRPRISANTQEQIGKEGA